MIKEKQQHKLLLSKKVVSLFGDGAYAGPPVAAQTDRRPAEQDEEHGTWRSRAWTAVAALTHASWGPQIKLLN